MKICYLIAGLLLITTSLRAQTDTVVVVTQGDPDSAAALDPDYRMQRYHDMLKFHDPYMYLAYPIINPIVDRRLDLRDGEGKGGYWAEGNFAYRFSVYNGKYYSRPWQQRLRMTFDVGLTIRLTNDYSSPLLPSNNKFGFGIDYLLSDLRALKSPTTTITWTTLQLHHYSNGQADSFFTSGPIKRNNYKGGDFSNNYWRALINVARVLKDRNVFSTGIGYQHDVDLGGPLSRSVEFKNYYGDNRVLLNMQWTRKPLYKTVTYANKSRGSNDSVNVVKRRQLAFRTEFDYILGNLDNFPGTNKYRLGWHSWLTYMPSVTNEVGFIAHTYLGRDYMNIRFDDVVFVAELGIYVTFNGK
jgi:hypothetical protein